MHHRFVTLTIFSAWLAVVSALAQAPPPRSIDILDGALARQIDDELTQASAKGFGGALIVEMQGKIVLKAGYGFADREARVPFTAETIAQIGSITKLLTALAVVDLADQGKLDLAAAARTYLPSAAEPAASTTLHRLLTHHAGLADSCGEDFGRVSKADLLKRCMAIPLAFRPGKDHYSNMGYSILAAVVEQVSGEPWEAYLRDHVFEPLGMKRTGFVFRELNRANFAAGYLKDKSQGLISDRLATLHGEDWNLKGNGGIQASTADMERLYRGLSGRAHGLSRSVVERMFTPHEQIEGEAWEGYGVAVRLDVSGKPYRIGQSGSDGVFLSYFGWLPQQDIFFYFVGNNGEADLKPVLVHLVRAVQTTAGVRPAGS